ncbi:MAG: sulfonate transport system permease protein [Thermoplasmata archaeon]|jgi:NitT/TauT family transport system permease protein|nr:sulfonate transport system permease protein [Thermoplasmata archaeon]
MRRIVLPALFLAVFLAAWHLVYLNSPWDATQFAGPRQVWDSIVRLSLDGSLRVGLEATLRRLFAGFALSMLAGGLLAIGMARLRPMREGLRPFLLGAQSLPSIAWVPLAVLWFGLTEEAIVFVTVIGSVFAVTIAFTDALNSVPPDHVLAARNMGSHGLALVTRVQIPAALPPLLSGTRQCWSFAWRSLLGAEIIIHTVGLGFLLDQGRNYFDVPQVMAVMAVTLAAGLLFEVLVFSTLEKSVRRRWGLSRD